MSNTLRSPVFLGTVLNLTGLGATTLYVRFLINRNLEEQEARFDEVEGTLRGHIGLIEESLERLEGKKKGRIAESQ